MDKKQRERIHIERFLGANSSLPSGTIEDSERPDFLLHTDQGLIGMEVTRVVADPESDGTTPMEQDSLRDRVLTGVKKCLDDLKDRSAIVSVFFDDSVKITKNNVDGIARRISKLVSDCIRTLEDSDYDSFSISDEELLPEEILEILIYTGSTLKSFSVSLPKFFHASSLSVDSLSAKISNKESVALSSNLKFREVWLVVVMEGLSKGTTFEVDDSILSHTYKTKFDRVFLFGSFEKKTFELLTNNSDHGKENVNKAGDQGSMIENEVINGKALIAVCDILGFSDRVREEELKTIIEDYKFLRETVNHCSFLFDGFSENTAKSTQVDKYSNVGMAFFSDTILLYTGIDSDETCSDLLKFVSCLLFQNLFYKPTRLRAGIAYDEVYIDKINNIFLGRGIVEAAELEKAQQWSGGALALSAEKRVNKYIDSPFFVDWPIVRCYVPIKKEDCHSNIAVNWTIGIHTRMKWMKWENDPGIYSEKHTEKNRTQEIIEKRENTKAFHEQFCQLCFPANRSKFNIFKRLFTDKKAE